MARAAAKAAVTLALGLAAVPGSGPDSAAAGNWTLGGLFTERLEADSNLRLEDGGEALWGSRSSVSLDFGYDTKRTAWRLGSGLTLSGFAGPGDSEDLNGFSDPRLTAGVIYQGKRRTLGADLGFVTRSTAYTLTDEFEQPDGSGDARETAGQLSASWTERLDGRNALSFTPSVSIRRFSGDEGQLTPSTTLGLTTGWSRSLDSRSTAGLNVTLRRIDQDGPETGTVSTVASLGASFSRRMTPRHGFDATLGVSRAVIEETVETGPGEATSERTSLGVSGALGFDWLGPGRTAVGLEASQDFEPDADGGLDLTTRVAAAVSRPLTGRASAGVAADLVRRVAEDGEEDGETVYTFSAGPRLDYALTRDWSAGLGVSYRRREDADGGTGGTRVFFELSRPFDIWR